MNNNAFDKYESKSVNPQLSDRILKTSSEKINPSLFNLSFKYGALFISSIFLSLSICPQRGVGLFSNDLPFFHHFFHQNEILCGLYCGLVFFLTTHLLTFLLLNPFERLKVVHKFSYLPLIFISIFFGFSMTSIFSKSRFGLGYNLSWILIVGLLYFLFNQIYFKKIKS